MGELCNAEEGMQLGGSLAVGDRAAWEGAMQWRAVQQGAVQHGGSCATGSHATRRCEMGSCASGRCATGGRRAMGRRATGRHAMGRRATGRCAMGRRATGGSHAMWSHATGRRATGRRATGCHAARLAQGWRVQVPSWPGSAQGWAPILVSAPSPAAPRWAAGRRPRGGNTPEGGGWGVTPAAPLHAPPHTAGKTRLQQRSGLREGDGAGTRAAGEGPEKGRHAAACAAQGPRASVRGAAPLPVPRPGRQHPVTGNVAGLCGESCAIPPRRHACARHPRVPPAACHVLPATCRERVWLSPRPPLAASCMSAVAAEANANLQRDRPKIINRAGFPLGTVGVGAVRLSRAEVPCRLPPSPHPSFAPARLGGAGCGHGAGAGGERGAAAGRELQLGRHVPPWWLLRVPGGVCVSVPPLRRCCGSRLHKAGVSGRSSALPKPS